MVAYWILIIAIAIYTFNLAIKGRSVRSTNPGRGSKSDTGDGVADPGERGQQPIGAYAFIQINQFLSINTAYPAVVNYRSNVPRFVQSAQGFKAKGMQSRYYNFKELLISNRLQPGNEYSAVVTLQIEPSNKFDKYAVLVTFRGLPLAYVPQEFSQAFHSALVPVGGAALCLADIWFDGQYHRGGKRNSITLLTSPNPRLER